MSLKKMSWLCKMGFHKWSTWGDKFKLPNSRYAFEYQQCQCLRCGEVKERTI